VATPEGTKTAHVAVWEYLFGPLDSVIHLHHTCPNKLCVSPFHQHPRLYTEHRREHARKRWAMQKEGHPEHLIGARKGRGHLGEHQRAEIHDLYFTRRATQQELADLFGVSRPTISKIVNGPRPEPVAPETDPR
jgi:hypothetical protein